MQYPKIIIPNLRKFRTERFNFFDSGLNIHDSCIESIDFTYYQKSRSEYFKFFGSGLNHSWLISTLLISKKSHSEYFNFFGLGLRHSWLFLPLDYPCSVPGGTVIIFWSKVYQYPLDSESSQYLKY